MNFIINNRLQQFSLWGLVVLLTACLFSCKKNVDYNEIISTDKTKPGIVTNVKVTNINGGAIITYTLPKSENLLYVQADYELRDGKKMQTKSSYFTDTIRVEGFQAEQEYTVTLHAVSRAAVMSDPVEVKVKPKNPVYKLLRQTLDIKPTYSGVVITGSNPDGVMENIVLLWYDDHNKQYKVVDQHYRSDRDIKYYVRDDFDTTLQKFAVYVSDKWGNSSDTLVRMIKPFYDKLLDKTKMLTHRLSTDAPLYSASGGWGPVEYMWDGNNGSGWHTASNTQFPIMATFNLGVSAQLNHFKMWERYDEWSFSHNNPKVFTIWGTNDATPQDVKLPVTSNVGVIVNGWVNLGNFRYPDPPSGNEPSLITDSDKRFVKDGVDFEMPEDSPKVKVKYLRVAVAETWGGSTDAHITELNLFADPR